MQGYMTLVELQVCMLRSEVSSVNRLSGQNCCQGNKLLMLVWGSVCWGEKATDTEITLDVNFEGMEVTQKQTWLSVLNDKEMKLWTQKLTWPWMRLMKEWRVEHGNRPDLEWKNEEVNAETDLTLNGTDERMKRWTQKQTWLCTQLRGVWAGQDVCPLSASWIWCVKHSGVSFVPLPMVESERRVKHSGVCPICSWWN